MFGFLDGAIGPSSCCSPNLRRDLAVEQGHWLEPVASCSSPRVGPRTSVRIRCLLFDHMIGRQSLRSGEPKAPLPRQGAAIEMLRQIMSAVKLRCAKLGFGSSLVPPAM